QQYLTDAFDNSSEARANQDVGLDGIPNELEAVKFQDFMNAVAGLSPEARARIELDPSADDFQYFLAPDFDLDEPGVLVRYKNINGMENNTPIAGNDLVARSGSPYPDNEDLNQDNTLNELEEYYEYDIDLRPGQLGVGREYIVDRIDAVHEGTNEQVTWYLFRIPVREVENRYGNISGFKSIRYVRMVLTDFAEPVELRLGKIRTNGSCWRGYPGQLMESGLIEPPEPNLDNFSVSVVNLEDNASADPDNNKTPYRIPPGVERDRDNTST